ncbi:MAG: hypothetical protein A2927_01645 [Candidatus Komeilibacteria bacterium RIFCSPLOWO2_01_FULL_45_10]|uniref:DUF2933 domain-containing protein n=1 Tax=Candidatus Komeilibacteria bacterium RIFCSPLOWO2_01_FULL_45_10 TaxID=1798550 RepID=A0A1G2BL20_9BACT|nr:MAG: hypothetical protein A2927_01645 [Candidatus Komeilibacteria bacterium RIFCSPLOWO2_01_FULL_45_10]
MNMKLLMLLCCLIPVAAIAAFFVFGVNQSYLLLAVVLLCPIMHLLLMRDMHGGKESKEKNEKCHWGG